MAREAGRVPPTAAPVTSSRRGDHGYRRSVRQPSPARL
jgi:hypothetical protein